MGDEATACVEETTDVWYEEIKRQVDYACSFCEAVQLDISKQIAKVQEAYAFTANSLRGVYDAKEIRERWWGMYIFAFEVWSVGKIVQDNHQICGVDLTPLEKYAVAAHERFLLHCPSRLEQAA